ncbi:hypothetical protein DFJ73DRAFT_827335, partial [Zopfochytrium polystomum]
MLLLLLLPLCWMTWRRRVHYFSLMIESFFFFYLCSSPFSPHLAFCSPERAGKESGTLSSHLLYIQYGQRGGQSVDRVILTMR